MITLYIADITVKNGNGSYTSNKLTQKGKNPMEKIYYVVVEFSGEKVFAEELEAQEYALNNPDNGKTLLYTDIYASTPSEALEEYRKQVYHLGDIMPYYRYNEEENQWEWYQCCNGVSFGKTG